MLVPELAAQLRPAAYALAPVAGVAFGPGPLAGVDLVVVTAAGIALVTSLEAPAGELSVAGDGSWRVDGLALPDAPDAVGSLRAAAAAVARRLQAAALAVPAPVPLLVVAGGAQLPGAGLLDVGGVLVAPAAAAAGALTSRAEAALIQFNTSRAVYPRDVAAVDTAVLVRLAEALDIDARLLPGDAALTAQGIGAGEEPVRDAGHAAADLSAALADARPDVDVLVDVTDAFRARHRDRLVAAALARVAALTDSDPAPVELVFAADDTDGVGLGVFVAVDGRVLYVPADDAEPVRAAWCSAAGRPLGVLPAAVSSPAGLAGVAPQPAAVADAHRAPRVRAAGLAARVADAERLTVSAADAFEGRLGLRLPEGLAPAVKQGSSGGQLVWAEAALPLGPARLAYTEYYRVLAGLPAPKSVRLELVAADAGKPTITRIGGRAALVDALRAARPAPDLSALPELAAEVGPGRRRWFSR